MDNHPTRVVPFSILGICIIAAATVFGLYFYASRQQANDIRVTGAASKQFDSDIETSEKLIFL